MAHEIDKSDGGLVRSDGGKGESLDLDDPKTRRMVQGALNNRWPITYDIKAELVNKAVTALRRTEDERAIAGLGKLLKDMEGQNQADEHLADKNNRLDDGKPTEIKRVYTVEFDE